MEERVGPSKHISLLFLCVSLPVNFFSSVIQYIEKPPEGKHSTKGLGKNIPLESEYARWRDGIVVPCGKPVPSKLKASELMYNEYIVYDTAQVSYLVFYHLSLVFQNIVCHFLSMLMNFNLYVIQTANICLYIISI